MRFRLCLLSVLICLLAIMAGGVSGAAASTPDDAVVHYHAGWNLVAVTDGTALPGATAAYTLGAGPDDYRQIAPGDLHAGQAAWVYFPQDTTTTLGRTAAESSRTVLPAGGTALVGNPTADGVVSVAGADMALAYDPARGYLPVHELRPGQGAFVFSAAGGTVTLGKIAADSASDQLGKLEAALSDNPTDQATLEQVATVTAELVRTRHYAEVQSALDDLRTSLDQGLRRQGSGPLPPLSTVEQDSAAQVREALARAKASADSGDTAGADAAVDQARRAAGKAEDDGVGLVSGGDATGSADAGAGSLRYAALHDAILPPLTAAVLLLRAGSFSIALGLPPGDPFWQLVQELASGQRTVPNTAPSGTPPPSLPPAPPPTPPASAACSFSLSQLALNAEELALLDDINGLRAEHGLPPLQISIALQRTAASKGIDMVTQRQYQHDAGFPDQFPRFQQCGYGPQDGVIGENLNGGHGDAASVYADWLSDSSHLVNILDPQFTTVGIKRTQTPDPNDPLHWVWVADFGDDSNEAQATAITARSFVPRASSLPCWSRSSTSKT